MGSNDKYNYYHRPGYGSDEFLIEFISGVEENTFLPDLLGAIVILKPVINDVNDLWVNDELILKFDSVSGLFTLSKDLWGFAFITSENNQAVIGRIDELLSGHPKFEKVPVDPERYKL